MSRPADAFEHGRRHVLRVGRQFGHDLRPAGEPQRRLFRQWRIDDDIVEMVIAPVVGHRLAGPQTLEDAEDLVGAPAALAQRHPGDLVFVRVPADPDAQFEAPARQVLQAGDLLGDKDRVAQCRDQDAGGERDPAGAPGGEAQGFERRQPGRAVEPARGQQVLDRPQRLVAARLDFDGEVAQPGRPSVIEIGKGIARQCQPETHCFFLPKPPIAVYSRRYRQRGRPR